ncbi:MAG: hypothetical protein PQJ61_16170 [Spirochaetales bacterium]|uniref:Uncharacterized protein n=1 Tax=Candidatus Thalassospirochaeta sargassi TaxID=3119039 RepID=A0AAJ1IFF8_9SPIO|nr:hypothetical protein [Spirochaetales bacterium]
MKFGIYILLLILFLTFPVSASDEEPAILVRGPIPHRGIEYLGVNAIDSQYGEYVYDEHRIYLYYTDEPIVLSVSWEKAECGIEGLSRLVVSDAQPVYSYTDSKGWTVFFSFDEDSGYICRFIEQYRSRQNYFLNIARDEIGFSFPALLDIDRE